MVTPRSSAAGDAAAATVAVAATPDAPTAAAAERNPPRLAIGRLLLQTAPAEAAAADDAT